MKRLILVLLMILSYITMVNASVITVTGDTLSKRVVNGLEMVPIKTTLNYCKELEAICWKLHVPDFDKSFQKFENKYPGSIDDPVSKEIVEVIADWREYIWTEIVPTEIKALLEKCIPLSQEGFIILLYIGKEGDVFAVEFMVSDDVLKALDTLPQNMMKDFYHNLLRQKCDVIKQVKFCLNPQVFDNKTGKEFITMKWNWYLYNKFGTCHPTKLQKMLEDGTLEKIFNGEKKKK